MGKAINKETTIYLSYLKTLNCFFQQNDLRVHVDETKGDAWQYLVQAT